MLELGPSTSAQKIRCAIYTRKSTEEGLGQDFNSLHAQREACEAYIASQKHEGWTLIPKAYDDRGISGGTLERPGVQQLLNDVDVGFVDQIVVYKVDRLTRSLTDFSKLVERLDAAGASFVSVTQSFNTATSMGRLTLNMLLSFAQFEREVTAERIRDKIAASKAKGLWMGGSIPYGYDKDGRSLKIRDDEAQKLKVIFDAYGGGLSIHELVETCKRKEIKTRVRKSGASIVRGGNPFTRGHLYELLSNPIYIGKIRHKGTVYDGQHKGIIPVALWDKVQSTLALGRQGQRTRLGNSKAKHRMPLLGVLEDIDGRKFVANHSRVKSRKIDYYVSREKGEGKKLRYPAKELESALETPVLKLLNAQTTMTANPAERGTGLESPWWTYIRSIQIQPGLARVSFNPEQVDASDLEIPFTMRRQKKELRICLEGQAAGVDETLLGNLAKARALYQLSKKGMTLKAASAQLDLDADWSRKLLPLAFLSPSIIHEALAGRLPPRATSAWFIKTSWPMDFGAQRKLLDTLI